MALSRICVYCGSSAGRSEEFTEAAESLGRLLAGEGITLVYGGGSDGLMGVLADAALSAGGEVVGVIPRHLFRRESVHTGLTTLIEVESMHERKQRMFELADAFVALPGGLGTLEELTETVTWGQLGLHRKPIATLDVDGYWRELHALLHKAATHGFLKEENLALVTNVGDLGDLLPALYSYAAPAAERWLELEET